jgi:IS5 family transposase
LRRRNAIEPIIGHTKSDGLLERNHLGRHWRCHQRHPGAAGHNLRLLVAWVNAFLRALMAFWLSVTMPEMAGA